MMEQGSDVDIDNDREYEEVPPTTNNGYQLLSDVATGTSISVGTTTSLLYIDSNGDEVQTEDDSHDENLESFDESDDLPFD